jgi:hypothetical protein
MSRASPAWWVIGIAGPMGTQPPTENASIDDGIQRGLRFFSVVSDLVKQFEFVQSNWINNANFPIAGSCGATKTLYPTDDGDAARMARSGGECARLGCRVCLDAGDGKQSDPGGDASRARHRGRVLLSACDPRLSLARALSPDTTGQQRVHRIDVSGRIN